MKYIITAVFICLVFSVKAQKLETLPSGLMTNGNGSFPLSTGTVIPGTAWVNSVTVTRDTIPVIMLYQDTSHYIYESFTIEACPDTLERSPPTLCWHKVDTDVGRGDNFDKPYFMMGYEVREAHPNQCCEPLGMNADYFTTYNAHIAYLDEYKHPLEKYIFVWLTHPL